MLGWIDITEGIPPNTVWGLSSWTRAVRQLYRLGCEEIVVLTTGEASYKTTPAPGAALHYVTKNPTDLKLQSITARHEKVLWLRGTHVYDTRILSELIASKNNAAFCDMHGHLIAACVEAAVLAREADVDTISKACTIRLRMEDIPTHILSLRVYVPAIAADARDKSEVRRAEKLFFDASVKGVMDILYTYVYLRMVSVLMRVISIVPLTPNQITIGYLFIAVAAGMAYARGEWGLGLALSALTMICDAWDGVLARLTFQSSKIGHWLDKVSHSIYHPMWYLAIAYHLSGGDYRSLAVYNAIALVLLFFIMKPITIRYNRRYGRSIYDTTDMDRRLRLISGTRWNMNMILLSIGAITGYFLEAFYIITFYGALSVLYWLLRYSMAIKSK